MTKTSKSLRLVGFGVAILALVAAGGLWYSGATAAVKYMVGSNRFADSLSSSAYLAQLPDGETKRQFILDCTGCHQLSNTIAFPDGQPRGAEGWEGAIQRMLMYGGAHTPFPVISAERDPKATAAWLAQHLTAPPESLPRSTAEGRAQIQEFVYPHTRDLPHDVAVTASGDVVITGMFTDQMVVLDPGAQTFSPVPIPVQHANPRSLEIDQHGNWWAVLGKPGMVARYHPASQEWTTWSIGMYAHDARYDGAGRVWFNGHFSRDPEVLGYVDVATGLVKTYQIPRHPRADVTGPVPYGLAVAPDGGIWGTELQGNRIFRFDPRTEEFAVHAMPTPHSGPRRLAVDAQGRVWIPEYANNRLTRFDPASEAFEQFELPIPDALPYVARVDPRSGTVWLGTAAADALLSFDPTTETFTVYGLPSRGALVRHIDVDPRTGDVWVAYGASPGIEPKIARVRI